MAEQDVKLMKGNEAIAHAAIRCGTDGYFGYPITPQSENKAHKKTILIIPHTTSPN